MGDLSEAQVVGALVEEVARVPMLAALPSAEQVLISRAARTVSFAAGRRLFSEGQPAQGCWLVRTGHVALDAHVPGRGAVVVQVLGPDQVLGWSWLVPPYRWHFGATAIEATRAIELDTVQLRALAEQDPRFGHRLTLMLFEELLGRLQATRARLLELYQGANGQR
ncbi:Crp/Fnr family transcriptional regulator [Pseudonocardia acaciae]|uniref:Crp/Fnr family transcriptional regulator n=1 Tax=Pseudonocardia acaciae TaxID=551276 RepID=UPI0006852966|nr:cyclic nucleotide-binding domain-containing protein [Pseudonocardia acaciae]